MVQLFAFRRSLRLIALALCSASIAVAATPASARSHHGAGRHARAYRAGHHARHYVHHHRRHLARVSRWDRGVAQMQAKGFAGADAAFTDTNSTLTGTGGTAASASASSFSAGSSFGSPGIVAEARRYIGGNPTGRGSLWCARFMNMVLQHSGYKGTGSDAARSFASYGQRVSGPQVGAIAVMARRGGGHVGIITG